MIALVCSALTLLELFIGRAGTGSIVGANKLIANIAIWVSTSLVLLVRSSVRHAEEFQTRELRPGDGDVRVLLTDGLIEHRNGAGEALGIEAATRLVAERADGAAGELVEALVQQSLRWSAMPEDDITVVVLRHRDVPVAQP